MPTDSTLKTSSFSSTVFAPATGLLNRLPLFWRFQIGGWLAFMIFSLPLNSVVLADVPNSIIFSASRDGLGFFLTLGMREIYRRLYRAKPQPAFLALVGAVVSVLGGALLTIFSLGFHDALNSGEMDVFTPSVIFAIFYFRTVLCGGWSLLYFEIKIMRDSMAWDLEVARRDAEKQQLEVQMLRAQMNPHFLFNALNTISAAVSKPGQHPEELIQALADYLRYSLKNRDSDLVPLGEEIEAINAFIAVESARFRDDLLIRTEIEPPVRELLVPGIVIQPLLENAIKYGKKTSAPPLQIRLRIFQPAAESIRIEVANTGHWIESPVNEASLGGVGMKNLRQRLDIQYAGKQKLEICEADGWVFVSVELPVLE